MNTAEQIRAINFELIRRLPSGTSTILTREIALDIHQALADTDAGTLQDGVDAFTVGAPV